MQETISAPVRRLLAPLVAATAFAALLAPASAFAATGAVTNGTLVYSAAPGETNNLSITLTSDAKYQLSDSGASTMTAGAGCSLVSGSVRCPVWGLSAISIDLGDGNDSATSWIALPTRIQGGTGNDSTTTNISSDVHDGGPGNDTLDGGWGNDVLDGGLGADVLDGSLGTDTATYAARTAAVTVTADGVVGDGEQGEGDNVESDVEVLLGGGGNDALTGNTSSSTITGGAGDDTVDGGSGNDTLDGGAGADKVLGGAGADKVAARDAATDAISCGADADTVTADAGDTTDADCEVVDRSATGDAIAVDVPEPADILQPDYLLQAPVVAISPSGAAETASGALAVRISCPRTVFAGCQGTVELFLTEYVLKPVKAKVSLARRRKVVKTKVITRLGMARYRLAAGENRAVQVRLSRRGKRKLAPKKTRKGARKIKLDVSALSTSSLGTTRTTRTVTVMLRRQPKPLNKPKKKPAKKKGGRK